MPYHSNLYILLIKIWHIEIIKYSHRKENIDAHLKYKYE